MNTPNSRSPLTPHPQRAAARRRQIRFPLSPAFFFILTQVAAAAEADLVRVQFKEVDTLFANPGQGCMVERRSPRPEPRFPCSVVCLRFDWGEAEPEEGRFNWELIDEVIAAWKPRGAAVAVRVMTCNAHSRGYYTSPKWLFDAGCKGFEYLSGGGDPASGGQRIRRIEPDYADPIYLAKHGAFIRALGERYDGRPDVEFFDIGSYGTWGEWHTSHPAPVKVIKETDDYVFKIEAVRKKDPSQKQRIELRDLKVDYGLEHVFEGVQE